jgi:hypothetical protein
MQSINSSEFLASTQNPLEEQVLAASHRRNSRCGPIGIKKNANIVEIRQEF